MVNNDSSTFQVECGTGKYLQVSPCQNDEILRFWEGDQAGKTSNRKFSTKDETHFLSSIRWRPQVVRAAPCQGRFHPKGWLKCQLLHGVKVANSNRGKTPGTQVQHAEPSVRKTESFGGYSIPAIPLAPGSARGFAPVTANILTCETEAFQTPLCSSMTSQGRICFHSI